MKTDDRTNLAFAEKYHGYRYFIFLIRIVVVVVVTALADANKNRPGSVDAKTPHRRRVRKSTGRRPSSVHRQRRRQTTIRRHDKTCGTHLLWMSNRFVCTRVYGTVGPASDRIGKFQSATRIALPERPSSRRL